MSAASDVRPQKKPIPWRNLTIGAIIQVFEVSTLGQPFEVLKTHMAGNLDRNNLAVIITKAVVHCST